MKRIFVFILALILAFSLFSCQEGKDETTQPTTEIYETESTETEAQDKEIEAMLSQESTIFGGFQKIFGMIDNADFPYPTIKVNGEKVQLTHGTYGVLLHSPLRIRRK